MSSDTRHRDDLARSAHLRAEGRLAQFPALGRGWPLQRRFGEGEAKRRGVSPALIVSGLLLLVAVSAAGGRKSISEFLATLSQLTPGTAIFITGMAASSVVIAALRLQGLTRALGHELTFIEGLRVVAVSQAAATFFFQFIGQIGSRSVLMSGLGVPVGSTVLIALIERVLGLGSLLVLSLGGAAILFGGVTLDWRSGGAELVVALAGLAAAFCTVIILCAREVWRPEIMPTRAMMSAFFSAAVMTFAAQACTLFAFWASAMAFAPDAPALSVAAASTIVMLASALPISFGGWGVRELGAVVALGAIGVGGEAAFSSAIVVGVLSLATVLLLALTPVRTRYRAVPAVGEATAAFDATSCLGWVLPLLTGILVVFQLHIPVGTGRINVNFADPVVIVGGGMSLLLVYQKRLSWCVPHLPRYLSAAVITLLIGFLHGWFSFGSNSWAMTKVWGAAVLIAYALTGGLIWTTAGAEGQATLLKVVSASFLGVTMFAFGRMLLTRAGMPFGNPALRAEGFAQDANAFAFQAMIVMAIALSVLHRWRAAVPVIASCVMAIWLSGSRSGGIAALAVVSGALWLNPQARGPGLTGFCLAVVALALPVAIDALMEVGRGELAVWTPPHAYILEARPSSDTERWKTHQMAIRMFLETPFWGQGLGAFVQTVQRADGSPLVIHSTYLWLLAELGLFGLIAVLAMAVAILKHAWLSMRGEPLRALVLLVILGWGAMSLVQDLAYQRLAWLVLGAALVTSPGPRACPAPSGSHPG